MTNIEKAWSVLETLLLNGPQKAAYIVKATGLPRRTVYAYLETFEAIGLVEIEETPIRKFGPGPRLYLAVDVNSRARE